MEEKPTRTEPGKAEKNSLTSRRPRKKVARDARKWAADKAEINPLDDS